MHPVRQGTVSSGEVKLGAVVGEASRVEDIFGVSRERAAPDGACRHRCTLEAIGVKLP